MDDINSNRYRVQSVFTRLHDGQDKDDILVIMKQLVRNKSPEQSAQLSILEDVDFCNHARYEGYKEWKGLEVTPSKTKRLEKDRDLIG